MRKVHIKYPINTIHASTGLLFNHCVSNEKEKHEKVFFYSREAGWHSMCSLTLERGHLKTCHYESDLVLQWDSVQCWEFTMSQKLSSRVAPKARGVLAADAMNTHMQVLQGLNGPLVKMSWACTQKMYSVSGTSTSNLVSEVVFFCMRELKIALTSALKHIFFSLTFWLPLYTPCCHRFVHFGPPWPGTAGQRRCRADPRSQGSPSWRPRCQWCRGWAAWRASLDGAARVWLEGNVEVARKQLCKAHIKTVSHTGQLQNQSLTNVSQVEVHCVGLQARVAVYVQREGNAVLLFAVGAVDILTAHSRSVGVQLTLDLVLVPKVETNRWVSNGPPALATHLFK